MTNKDSGVEQLARAICAYKGIDAEVDVTRYHMAVVDGLTILPPKIAVRKAWEEYIIIAEMAMKIARAQK